MFSTCSVTGRLVDAYKNYELIFYMAGGELIVAALFLAVASYCCLKPQSPDPKDQSNNENSDIEGHSDHNDHDNT